LKAGAGDYAASQLKILYLTFVEAEYGTPDRHLRTEGLQTCRTAVAKIMPHNIH
jgi:hypothetical protein